jgi:hypothetical protein
MSKSPSNKNKDEQTPPVEVCCAAASKGEPEKGCQSKCTTFYTYWDRRMSVDRDKAEI